MPSSTRSQQRVPLTTEASLALVAAVCLALSTGSNPHAQGCGSNPIVCENNLAGNPESEWDVTGAGDATIQGYATDISVNKGGTVHFKVSTTASAYRLDIYRMGYYGGSGARLVATSKVLSAFISKIREVPAKRLPPAKAAEFIASATAIRAAYGCR